MFRKRSWRFRLVRFIVLSSIVFLLYSTVGFPLAYSVVLILFFALKAFPFDEFLEGWLTSLIPGFVGLDIWVRRCIIFLIYVLLILLLKFFVVDFFMAGVLSIPVREELHEFFDWQ